MLKDADPEFVQIVSDYLEAQREIANDDNSMDCSLWRPPTDEVEEFSLLGDGAIVFLGKYAQGKYLDLELEYGMSEKEIDDSVEAKIIPLADPTSTSTFIIEDGDYISVEPGLGVVIPFTVLCLIDANSHTYVLIKET